MAFRFLCVEFVVTNARHFVYQAERNLTLINSRKVCFFYRVFRCVVELKGKQQICLFSVKHNKTVLFTLLATSFGRQTVTSQSLHSIYYRLHINITPYRGSHNIYTGVNILLQPCVMLIIIIIIIIIFINCKWVDTRWQWLCCLWYNIARDLWRSEMKLIHNDVTLSLDCNKLQSILYIYILCNFICII
jgi:hypothetical protein